MTFPASPVTGCPACGAPLTACESGPCADCGGRLWVHAAYADARDCRAKRCGQGHLMRLEVPA